MSPRLIAFAAFGVLALVIVTMKTSWEETPAAPHPVVEASAEQPPPIQAAPAPRAPKALPAKAKGENLVDNDLKTPLALPRDPSEETERYADPELVEKRDAEEQKVRELRGGLVTQ